MPYRHIITRTGMRQQFVFDVVLAHKNKRTDYMMDNFDDISRLYNGNDNFAISDIDYVVTDEPTIESLIATNRHYQDVFFAQTWQQFINISALLWNKPSINVKEPNPAHGKAIAP